MVCLSDGSDVSVDGCQHVFCEECIVQWCYYGEQTSCPTCRAPVRQIRSLATSEVLHEFIGPVGTSAPICEQDFALKQRALKQSMEANRSVEAAESGAAVSRGEIGADADDCAAASARRDNVAATDDRADACSDAAADVADSAEVGAADDLSNSGCDGGHIGTGFEQNDVGQMIARIVALNTHSGKGKSARNRADTVTTNAIAAAQAEAQTSRKGLRSAGRSTANAAAEPNEYAGLRGGADEALRNKRCRCARCGYTCALGLQLGRAHAFEHKQTTMWGATSFEAHPVAEMLQLAVTLMHDYGWNELTIPFCDRDYLDDALRRSDETAAAAAQRAWHSARLNSTAQAARAVALELPFVEAPPDLDVEFANGVSSIQGVHMAFVCVDREHVLSGSAALRALWAHELSAQVIDNYDPIRLSEETLLRIVAHATMHGNRTTSAKGEQQAAAWIANEDAAIAVVQMDSATLARVRAASRDNDVEALRACLRKSAVSHVLAPRGGLLSRPAEEVARSSEAAAFAREPHEMAQQSFCRAGAAAGMFRGASAVSSLAQHPDMRDRAAREWPEHISFIAPSNADGGLKAVAMRYIADEAGRARKRKSRSGETSTRMVGDGANQPRYVRLHPPVRGAELDGEALKQLSQDEAYMRDVRAPQQAMAGRILLTLLHFGYGMEALSADQRTNPFEVSAVTWLRVCSEQPDFDAASHYFARGTRASLVSQPMAVHVDGVAQRRQRPRTSVELLTTRWAEVAYSWSDSQRKAELAAARRTQPLVATSLWLRTSISLNVTPCRGLALVAVPLPTVAKSDIYL